MHPWVLPDSFIADRRQLRHQAADARGTLAGMAHLKCEPGGCTRFECRIAFLEMSHQSGPYVVRDSHKYPLPRIR
jgi:hypothetical protein